MFVCVPFAGVTDDGLSCSDRETTVYISTEWGFKIWHYWSIL